MAIGMAITGTWPHSSAGQPHGPSGTRTIRHGGHQAQVSLSLCWHTSIASNT